MREAQELAEPTEQYFAQPLDVSVFLYLCFVYPSALFTRKFIYYAMQLMKTAETYTGVPISYFQVASIGLTGM